MSFHEKKDPRGASSFREDKEAQQDADNATIVDDTQIIKELVPPVDDKAPPLDFPDGGLRAWLVVLAVSISLLVRRVVRADVPLTVRVRSIFNIWLRERMGGAY